jgi:hypothetical protein
LNEVLCDFVNGTKHNFASLIESRGNAKQIFNNLSFIQVIPKLFKKFLF